LVAAALGALAVRLAYILIFRRNVLPMGDSFSYDLGSRLLVQGHGFIEPQPFINGIAEQSANHPPLYLVYLAIPSSVGLDTAVWHMLWSSLLGVGTIVLVGLVAKEVAGPRAGLVAAFLAALYPNLWLFDGFILSETMAMFMVALSVLLAYRYLRAPSVWLALALGFACGLGALARAELVLLLPLLALPCILFTRRTNEAQKLKGLVAAGVAAVVAIGPWVGFNLVRFEKPVFLSTGLGPTMLGANCDATYYGNLTGYFTPECTAPVKYPPGADQSERDVVARRIAFDYIDSHKARVPVVVLARWGRITGLYRPWNQVQLDDVIEGRERWAAVASLISFYIVAILAIAGAVLVRRRRRVPLFPLLVPVVIVLFAVALSLGSNRYRASAEVVLVVMAAVAIDRVIASRRDRPADSPARVEAPREASATVPGR
jgi:4-amino-4-deoxy-L-arabinose transferase-like glycosyltransferase